MDLSLGVDPALETPLHRQVYDALRAGILAGRMAAGERLPATRVLAEQLAVSRNTVAEAYDQLQAEGYVEARQGSGTYVAGNLPNGHRPARPAPPQRPMRLSAWGERVTSEPYRSLFRAAEPSQYTIDFRAHAVARDSFPWDAWEESVERAIRRSREKLLSYPPSAGHPELLRAIASHVAQYRGVRCDADQVVVVNGTQQGLNLLGHLLFDPGDRVVVEDPGYPTARLALQARGLEVSRVPVDAEGLEVARLEAGAGYRLVHVTPSHQDPTGATLSLSRRLALLEYAAEHSCVVFEDDYDSEFRYEGRPVESLQGLDRHGLVVYAGTFSKSVLAGLRIGYLVLPPGLVRPFVAAKTLWDSGAPMLEQVALVEFMRSGEYERHIRKMRRLYRGRRDALVDALETTFGPRVTVGTRHGGLNVLISLDLPFTETELTRRAAEAGVALRPAAAYFTNPPPQPTFLMGFAGVPEERMAEGIHALAAALPQAETASISGAATGA